MVEWEISELRKSNFLVIQESETYKGRAEDRTLFTHTDTMRANQGNETWEDTTDTIQEEKVKLDTKHTSQISTKTKQEITNAKVRYIPAHSSFTLKKWKFKNSNH